VSCEYWAAFSADTWQDWQLFTGNVVSLLRLNFEKAASFFQTIQRHLSCEEFRILGLLALKICFEGCALPQTVLFEIFTEHFNEELSRLIESKSELVFVSALVNAIARSGSIGNDKEFSRESFARYRTVQTFSFGILDHFREEPLPIRLCNHLLSTLAALIESKSLNFGVLLLLGDSSFFELATSVLMSCQSVEFHDNRKFMTRILRLFALFVEYFSFELLSPEIWNFFVRVVSEFAASMKRHELKIICFVFLKVMAENSEFSLQIQATRLTDLVTNVILAFHRKPTTFPRRLFAAVFRQLPDALWGEIEDQQAADRIQGPDAYDPEEIQSFLAGFSESMFPILRS
jgi:hypothetical protein